MALANLGVPVDFVTRLPANDRQKLYALVEYVREEGDRKAFIARYFGVAPGPPEC